MVCEHETIPLPGLGSRLLIQLSFYVFQVRTLNYIHLVLGIQ